MKCKTHMPSSMLIPKQNGRLLILNLILWVTAGVALTKETIGMTQAMTYTWLIRVWPNCRTLNLLPPKSTPLKQSW